MSRPLPLSPPVLFLLCGVAVPACGGGESEPKSRSSAAGPAKKKAAARPRVSAAQVLERARKIFAPLPEVAQSADNPISEEKVTLGRLLYFDPRLSKNHDVSCNTCHDLEKYGIDVREQDGKRVATSPGHKGALGDRNSPTVYNAAIQFSQFWDGRAADVEEQAMMPILNPVEMAMPDEASVIKVLQSIPGYVEAFQASFPEDSSPITSDNMARAIGAFERKLMTPAPFDAFLAGNMGALSQDELWGLQLFMDVGCTTCHTGPGVGGTMYQKLGSVKPWKGLEDVGRFKVTEAEPDRFVFKVATLRNVTETSPYLHNGSVDSLEEMVKLMAEHQTAKGSLTPDDLASILAFLGSLKGDLPEAYIQAPQLPESGPETPAPDPS